MKQPLLLLGLIAMLTMFNTVVADTPDGAALFERNCVSCHTIGQGDRVGPDLAGVTERRDKAWLHRQIQEPDVMIAEGDPVAMELVEQYNGMVMPNLGLDDGSVTAILDYMLEMDSGTADGGTAAAAQVFETPELMQPQARIWQVFLLISAIIVLVFAVIAFSTSSPREVDKERAYGIRKVLFLVSLVAVIGILATTLPKTPYEAQHDESAEVDRIIYVAARQFNFIWSEQPITDAEDINQVPQLREVDLAPGSTVEFRVTSVDVTHGFGLYGPERQRIAQTQAMPGYINRLRVRVDKPGQYLVLCLEYCAAGHHYMRSSLNVREL